MASRQATLEYLTTTKIGEKGQLTVPKQFRKDLGLRTGAPFAVLRLGDGLVLLPEQQRFEHLCEQVSSALTGAGLTPETFLATLPLITLVFVKERTLPSTCPLMRTTCAKAITSPVT